MQKKTRTEIVLTTDINDLIRILVGQIMVSHDIQIEKVDTDEDGHITIRGIKRENTSLGNFDIPPGFNLKWDAPEKEQEIVPDKNYRFGTKELKDIIFGLIKKGGGICSKDDIMKELLKRNPGYKLYQLTARLKAYGVTVEDGLCTIKK